MKNSHKSTINLTVSMDENRVPETIEWSAEEGSDGSQHAKAMLLSIWDGDAHESLKIDLWTKDMPLDDMKIFFHQTLLNMSDTFFKATGDEKMTATMKDFCNYFSEKLELKDTSNDG